MYQMFRKSIVMVLIFVLTISMLVACSQNESASSKDGSSSGKEISLKDGKFDPQVELSLIKTGEPYSYGESMNDNVLTKWALERLGIDLNYLWEAEEGDAYNNKIRLNLSANKDMPDALYVEDKQLIIDLISSGKFMEVGPLFDKYANDIWKDAMESQPGIFHPYLRDDKLMALPMLKDEMSNEAVMQIRTDWLKKLNLDVPKTVEELEVVMDAFVNKDPDGNGKNDTIGLSIDMKNGFFSDTGDISWLFGTYGTLPGIWNDFTGTGKLDYGSIQPEAKEALAKLIEWKSKGFIHEEVGLWDGQIARDAFISGQAGIIFTTRWPVGRLEAVERNIEGAEFHAYPLPVGNDGTVMRVGNLGSEGAILINKDAKNPEAFFVMTNYFYEHFATPEKGGEFEHGMFEGYDYVITEDGNWSRSDEDYPEGTKRVRPFYYTITEGAVIPNQKGEALYKLYKGEKAETPYEVFVARDNSKHDIETLAILVETKDQRVLNQFSGAPTKTMQSRGGYLQKLELEIFQKIIYEKEPIDAFDKFVEEYKSNGGKEIIKEVNEWYKEVTE